MAIRKRTTKTKGRARTAGKKRGRSTVTSPIEILNDVRDAVAHGARSKGLAPGAQDRLEAIFEQTVGRFRQKVRASKPNEDIWRDRKFKAYILRVARKIGRDAAQTNQSEISAHVLNASAVDVMLDENRTCNVRIDEGGHVQVDTQGGFHGPVCSDFLADQTG